MNKRKCVALGMALVLTASSAVLTGCGSDKTKDGRTIVTMLQYLSLIHISEPTRH